MFLFGWKEPMIAITEREFSKFAEFVKTNYGIHFKDEKRTLVAGRLSGMLESMHMSSLSEYTEYVMADRTGQAATAMLDKITTNYTYFMREADHFDYFKDKVLPYLAKTVKDRDLRIWSAACSTGEEPYTLAMLIQEFFGQGKAAWDTKILATDISQGVLAKAKAGIYGREKIANLPEPWKKRYFREYDGENLIVSEHIRNEVIFSNINLMTPMLPFRRKMHVIFCRNVMIYFDNETKDRLCQRLYEITEPGGFLFVGHSESLNRERTKYRCIMPAVYRKE